MQRLKNRAPIYTSTIASEIAYTRLETSSKTLYSRGISTVYSVGSDFLLAKTSRRISLFDRETGAFIKDIGHRGIDPGGYSNGGPNLGVNEQNFSVYAKGKKGALYEYAITSGRLEKIISKPEIIDSSKPEMYSQLLIGRLGFLNDTLIVGYIPNLFGTEKLKLVAYDVNGAIIKTYANHQSFVKDPKKFNFNPSEAIFHVFDGDLFFKEQFNDTTFKVGLDTLKPMLYFDLGKHSPLYDKKESMNKEERAGFMFIAKMSENSNFIFFHIRFENGIYLSYYDKNDERIYVAENLGNKVRKGFINDIDGFLPFYPEFINEQGEILGLVRAEEVVDWLANNPEKIAALPEHLKKLQSMQPEDNPLVMIAKAK